MRVTRKPGTGVFLSFEEGCGWGVRPGPLKGMLTLAFGIGTITFSTMSLPAMLFLLIHSILPSAPPHQPRRKLLVDHLAERRRQVRELCERMMPFLEALLTYPLYERPCACRVKAEQ